MLNKLPETEELLEVSSDLINELNIIIEHFCILDEIYDELYGQIGSNKSFEYEHYIGLTKPIKQELPEIIENTCNHIKVYITMMNLKDDYIDI